MKVMPIHALVIACLAAALAGCNSEPLVKSTPPISGYDATLAAAVLRQGDYERASHLAGGAVASENTDTRSRRFAFGIRADAALHTGRDDAAAADLAALLRLDPASPATDLAAADGAVAAHPNRPEAYFARAALALARGDRVSAIRDSDIAVGLGTAAIRITGRDSEAWESFDQGRFQQAIERLGDNSASIAAQPYALLLLHLARAKLGRDDHVEMAQAVDAAGLAEWPAPVLAFYLGRIDQEQLFTAAESGTDHQTRVGQRCEAKFYVGEAASLHGDIDDALSLLDAAQRDCPRHFAEADAAGAERGRLRHRGG